MSEPASAAQYPSLRVARFRTPPVARYLTADTVPEVADIEAVEVPVTLAVVDDPTTTAADQRLDDMVKYGPCWVCGTARTVRMSEHDGITTLSLICPAESSHGRSRPARDVIRERTGPDTPERVIHVAHVFGCQDGPEGRWCPTHSPEDLGDEPMRYFTLPSSVTDDTPTD